MSGSRDGYDSAVLDGVCRILGAVDAAPAGVAEDPTESIPLRSLRLDQVIARAILTTEGTALVGAGQTVTPTILERLHNFAGTIGIQEPIVVQRPRAGVPSGA